MKLQGFTMFTAAVEQTTEFYRHFLGVEPFVAEESIAIFDVDGVEVLIHEQYEPDEGELPPEDHAAYAVSDVDETFATLRDRGLEVFREPADYDWGRSAYLRDPDGRMVELVQE